MSTTNRWGVLLDERTADMLDEAQRLSGVTVRCTQGSYSGGSVGASAGTHDGCGAADLSTSGYNHSQTDAQVLALRQVGFAAWHRTPSQGFDSFHIHAIAVQPGGKGDRGCLSSGAHDQVIDYYEGRNGLASGAPDDGPRQYVGTTWETYGGQDMTPEQAQQLANVDYFVQQIRAVDLPPIRERTDTLQPALANIDYLTYNSVVPAIIDISTRLAGIEDALGIGSSPMTIPTEPPEAS